MNWRSQLLSQTEHDVGSGTIDYGPFLSVNAGTFQEPSIKIASNYLCIALDFRERIGGERNIQEYCHRIALEGGRKAAEILGTDIMDERDEFTASMVRLRSFISQTEVEPS